MRQQPSNPEIGVVADVRERAVTPAPLPPDTKKQDSPGKPTQDTPTLSSPTNPPTTTATASTLPPPSTAPVTSSVTSHPPPQTAAVPSTDPPVTSSPEGGGVATGPSDAGTNGQGTGRGEISIEPNPPKEPTKPLPPPAEGTAKLLESTSTNSLLNSPITTVSEEGGTQSPPTDHDAQPPPVSDTATITTSAQTGQEKEKEKEKSAVLGAAVSASVTTGAMQVTEETQQAPGSNGGKKKGGRGKAKMTLTLINVTRDDVVKCMLVTKNELKIKFQFSSKFDETKAIFKKLVSSN